MKKFVLPLALVALIAVSALSGCSDSQSAGGGTPSPTESPTTPAAGETGAESLRGGTPTTPEPTVIGEGETVFSFEVTDGDGNVSAWAVHTDETTVGAALLAAELIDGEQQSAGLYVTTVNGITADYAADGAWWCFYIDGAMAMTGADSAPIEPGKTYAFVYTVG